MAIKPSFPPERVWWYWWHVQTRLTKWTLALLQGRRYTVRLEPEGTGYHDPIQHVIQANPQLFPKESPETQFRLTQGILAHEVGHALFTGDWPDQSEGLLQQLVNILEDQRIEQAIACFYPGVTPAIRLLGDLMYRDTPAVLGEPEYQVLATCLVWRWAHSRVTELKMFKRLKIKPGGKALWRKVKPLVEAAWTALNTSQVITLAREILTILDLPTGMAPLPGLPVENHIPAGRSSAEPGPLPFPDRPAAEAQPGLGKGVEHIYRELPADAYSAPAPYVELEAQALPLAQQLAEALKLPRPDMRLLAHEWQGRYSFRQEVRTPDTPHLYPQGVGPAPRSLALYVLVDRSGSMREVETDVRLALMTLYLAADRLELPIGLAYFGGDDEERGDMLMELAPIHRRAWEPVKAVIAGYTGTTSAEYLWLGLELAERQLSTRPEKLKVLLCLHDGEPVYKGALGSDWHLSQALLRRINRFGITPIGIYLGASKAEQTKLSQLFPRLVACPGSQLPEKLGQVLRSLA